MLAAQGSWGRVFVLRLEDGDRIPESIERFAAQQGVSHALCSLLGGIGSGSLVVGPRASASAPVTPLVHELLGVHEAAAVGVVAPGVGGGPVLHMHAALGREGNTRTGCVRRGLEVWQVGEVVLAEICGVDLERAPDPATGFDLLGPASRG